MDNVTDDRYRLRILTRRSAFCMCNTQSELHPLEEGKHAAESGLDLKAYAEQAGKVYRTLYDRVRAWRVLSVLDTQNADHRDRWNQLAEIHAAPSWLWAALVGAAAFLVKNGSARPADKITALDVAPYQMLDRVLPK